MRSRVSVFEFVCLLREELEGPVTVQQSYLQTRGLLGSGSPKSQPHQALRGVPNLPTGSLTGGVLTGQFLPRFRDGHDHYAGGSSNSGN